MKPWNKTLLFFCLICYLAVSSMATAHAFPSLTNTATQAENITSSFEMSTDIDTEIKSLNIISTCHQPQDTTESSFSTCEIFCTTMANIINNESVLDFSFTTIRTEITFIKKIFYNIGAILEPHPPK